MRDRKKRNIIIGSLCCLLVFMGVGYAVLSQTLNINGTATLTGEWEIFIDSITVSEIAGSAKSNVAEVSDDKMGASFDVELLKPGDYVEYEVVVKNDGTINAVLRELVPSIETNNMDILLTHSIIQGQILKAKSETKFTLKIRFDERATEIVTGGATSFDIKMIYEQYDGDATQIDPELVPVTANNCFDITNDGTIVGYDYSCGTYVTVPAVVNDIAVKKINRYAFSYNYNSALYFENKGDELPKIVVAQDSETYTMVMGLLKQLGGSEATGISVLMKGDKLPDTASGMYRMKGDLDATMNVTAKYPNIEYLDLSQASALTEVEASAFASDSNTNTLKYLNLDGVSAGALNHFSFQNADLEYLTVDSDLYNSFGFVGMTTDTLRVLKGENSNEIIGTGDVSALNRPTINNLIIGEGIVKVQGFGHRRINTLELPSTLVEIGDGAFQQNNLTTLKLPASVKTIGDSAFAQNKISDDGNPDSPGSQYWFTSVETIGDYAFQANSLVDVRTGIVKTIGKNAFSNNVTMRRVYINSLMNSNDNILESIGSYAFEGNGITGIQLKNIKNIGEYAFANNDIIYEYFGIGSTIETIGQFAFSNNPNMSAEDTVQIYLGNVKSIGDGAFANTGRYTHLLVSPGNTTTYEGRSAEPYSQAHTNGGVIYAYRD